MSNSVVSCARFSRKLGAHGSHDWSSAVASDKDGNFFVCGQTDGRVFSSAGSSQDMWVAKLDGERGDTLWGYQSDPVSTSSSLIPCIPQLRVPLTLIPRGHAPKNASFIVLTRANIL